MLYCYYRVVTTAALISVRVVCTVYVRMRTCQCARSSSAVLRVWGWRTMAASRSAKAGPLVCLCVHCANLPVELPGVGYRFLLFTWP